MSLASYMEIFTGFALEAAQTHRCGVSASLGAHRLLGTCAPVVPSGSIPPGGSHGMLRVHRDEQHPPAEDPSWAQERANPLQTLQITPGPLIFRCLVRNGDFGDAGWVLGSWVLKNTQVAGWRNPCRQ